MLLRFTFFYFYFIFNFVRHFSAATKKKTTFWREKSSTDVTFLFKSFFLSVQRFVSRLGRDFRGLNEGGSRCCESSTLVFGLTELWRLYVDDLIFQGLALMGLENSDGFLDLKT